MALQELRFRFQSWLRSQSGWSSASVTALRPVEGGASNLTLRASLAHAPVVDVALRLQRERGIFEPYDVLREAQVLRALARTSVPVPAVLFTEEDPRPLGAPFAVLEWVDAPHMGEVGPEADFGAYVAAVVRIHELDWRAAGLGFLAEGEAAADAVRAAIRRVAARARAWGLADDEELGGAEALLRATLPEDGELALCHGDINVFNYLFRDRRVVAVLDWEQAAIADPRLDIGQLLALSHLKGAPWGNPEGNAFVREYARLRGRPVPGLSWFRAFWLWQLAVIYEGWVRSNPTPPWYSRASVRTLLCRALKELAP